jgi:ATP-dependent HslUV protease ATP-binding subunit HslU
MEKIVEDISFNADEFSGEKYIIDEQLIEEKLDKLVDNEDTTRYIL